MAVQEIQAAPDPNIVPPAPVLNGIDPNTPPSTQVKEGVRPNDGYFPINGGKLSDKQALALVLTDFDRAAAYRQSNHETRWQRAAEAYLAYNPGKKYWEGTKTPRANMQVHLCFQQVEALLPQAVDAITGNDLNFDVEAARAGTTITQCHLVRDVINYQIRSLGGTRTKFLSWREVIRRMFKDGLIYGNGIAEWGWEGPYQVPQKTWARYNFPEMQTVQHWTGGMIQQPTGRMASVAIPSESMRTVSNFWLDPCALTDFYIDPNTRGPNVQEGDFAIRRVLLTVQTLAGMRGQKGWNIPDDKRLIELAGNKQWTQGDTTQQMMAEARGENIQPTEDFSADPMLRKVEVLRYFQKDKHIWVLGRAEVAFNGGNDYGAIPFSNFTYVDVPNAFYGLSIPDIVETDQALAKALIDGRLDEIALILHPPFISKAGTFRSQSQSRFSPGRNMEVTNDPQKDLIRMEMGNVTQSAYIEVDSLENRVQKKTGVTDLAVLGTPSSGGNSANRTATGVAAQTNASNTRVHYLVANFEDQTAGPLLDVIWQLTREFMNPNELMEIVGNDGQQLLIDPVDLLNADPRFVMKTAQRMKQRAGLQGGGMNMLLQYFLNPEIGSLTEEQQGKVLDVEQVSELFCDTFNIRASSFFRPMTPQEQQASQQRKQQPVQEKLAVQNARLQQMSQDAQERDDTKLMDTFVGKLVPALIQAGFLHNAVGLEAPVQLEAKRLSAEIEGGQFEAQPNAQ